MGLGVLGLGFRLSGSSCSLVGHMGPVFRGPSNKTHIGGSHGNTRVTESSGFRVWGLRYTNLAARMGTTDF